MASLYQTPHHREEHGQRGYPGPRRYSRPNLEDESYQSFDDERSFQHGMDPIERDWGDSRSVFRQGMNESSITMSSRQNLGNASYKRRSEYYHDEEPNFSRRTSKDTSHSNGTRSTAMSSCSGQMNLMSASRASFDQRRNRMSDRSESALASRPDFAGSRRRDNSRLSSSCSVSSVGSRSAPARRTPIPREPSLYRRESSQSEGSQSRAFSYSRRAHSGDSTRRRSQEEPNHMPPDTVDIVLSQCSLRQPRDRRQEPQSSAPVAMVDIAPGVQVPLRGTAETYKAVSNDFYHNLSCFGCTKELCCIADVSYVVCPECKVISPLADELFEGKKIRRRGLGLGFSYGALFDMQMEIMKGKN